MGLKPSSGAAGSPLVAAASGRRSAIVSGRSTEAATPSPGSVSGVSSERRLILINFAQNFRAVGEDVQPDR